MRLGIMVVVCACLCGACGKKQRNPDEEAMKPEAAGAQTAAPTAQTPPPGAPAPPADASPAPATCDDQSVRARLRAARTLDKATKLDEALAAFEALAADCLGKMPAARNAWLLSDLAHLQHRRGDSAACRDTLEKVEDAWLAETAKAAKAIRHNAYLCREEPADGEEDVEQDSCDYYLAEGWYCDFSLRLDLAPRAAYAKAISAPCPHTGEDAIAIALPDRSDRCLLLETGGSDEEVDEEDEEKSVTCPLLALLDKKGGRTKKTPLELEAETFLQESSDCCNANSLATLMRGREMLIIVTSSGPARDCYGGTASVDHFEVFRLEGTKLHGFADLAVGMH